MELTAREREREYYNGVVVGTAAVVTEREGEKEKHVEFYKTRSREPRERERAGYSFKEGRKKSSISKGARTIL